MATKGYLGIDAGTQGLSAIFTDEQLNVLGTGEGRYDMVPNLAEGCYEQRPGDWEDALSAAMEDLRSKLVAAQIEMNVLAIGMSGQMHGEVLVDAKGDSLGPARLWCDSRNEEEGSELTQRLGVKMPKRITSARWLWTMRNEREKAKKAAHMTTPAGWIAYRLTGQWNLGIGDAAGMFPIDQEAFNYNETLLALFDELPEAKAMRSLGSMLPAVRRAGEEAGDLHAEGPARLGLPAGIPVAAAEGDQPAAMAGSLIGSAGVVSVSFGTSVCANSVGDRSFRGVSPAIDHFCAADGKPINMVWLRNGTTFMNSVVKMFGQVLGNDHGDDHGDDHRHGFAAVMPQLLAAAPDCGGLLALPFMDDEPGLGVSRGGTAMVLGINPDNATPGNVVKAALLSTMFNLKLGSEELDAQGFPRTEIVLTGGLTRTPELAQILADVFDTAVVVPDTAQEGTAWGAALLAKYRYARTQQTVENWSTFLSRHNTVTETRFTPDGPSSARYDTVYAKYKRLIEARTGIDGALQ